MYSYVENKSTKNVNKAKDQLFNRITDICIAISLFIIILMEGTEKINKLKMRSKVKRNLKNWLECEISIKTRTSRSFKVSN